MGDDAAADAEREKRKRKQFKRMGKVLAHAWQLDESTGYFQEDAQSTTDNVYCLQVVGQKLDEKSYRLGRHGWEDFARDLGGVYNRHIQSKTKQAETAKVHLDAVKELLGQKDDSLAKIATEYVPAEISASKKRRSSTITAPASTNKKKKANKNSELAQREERAMEQLVTFIEERGGSRDLVADYQSRVTKKGNGKFDVNFFNLEGRRYRSMLEVGRFFKLVDDGGRVGNGTVRRTGFTKKVGSRQQEAERKKLRKELERLRKAHQRATKSLDDFASEAKESRYPIDDRLLLEEEIGKDPLKSLEMVRSTSAAARVCDIEGFPGIPSYCIPDVLICWDFLCTFERALGLAPIGLDDFAAALSYNPPEGQLFGDDVVAPPVYMAECHLALLKLVLSDRSSDDWWWSILETDESELQQRANELEQATESDIIGAKPVIKVDMAALLAETEDPLITTSWLRALEDRGQNGKSSDVREAIRTALKVVANKWVIAYLRKALSGYKKTGPRFAKCAIVWLVNVVRQARPDLVDRTVTKEIVFSRRANVLEETTKQMESLGTTVPTVTDEDASSDNDYDEDEDSDDDSDDDGTLNFEKENDRDSRDEVERPASAVPPKPLPTFTDMLLPPDKPNQNAEYLNSFTWGHLAGAVVSRVIHRKKRVWNEVDDYFRVTRERPPLTIAERRERESQIVSRVLTECADGAAGSLRFQEALDFLCAGGDYLLLDINQRLCLLRLLIESAYDTVRVYEVVDSNYKQRANAMKSLELEQRKARKDAKEKAAADEAAAREKLASEVREKFMDEKREEIRKLNDKSKEFSDEFIESLTEEDILDFDEDIKSEYDALPGPDTFSKTQISKMVVRMQEEAAFDTDALRVVSLEQLVEREKNELEEMEGELSGYGGEEVLDDPSLDRDAVRTIDRLCRDIEKAKIQANRLPLLRESALEQLRDAMEDGTIKVLRSAITTAKKAKLTGLDDETGGVWAVDLMRDAALELDNAKQNKKVVDATKDLIAKRNKCFIRSDPLGRDRFGSRFWTFDNEEHGKVWVETEYMIQIEGVSTEPTSGYLQLQKDEESITVGARDMEEDFSGVGGDDDDSPEAVQVFGRLEYHTSGSFPTLTKSHWGCQLTEESLRSVIKNLDSRGVRENQLKTALKDALEETVGADDKQDFGKEDRPLIEIEDEALPENGEAEHDGLGFRTEGDEILFKSAMEALREQEGTLLENIELRPSAVGQCVRIRQALDPSKKDSVARYENGIVSGWMLRRDKVKVHKEGTVDYDHSDKEDTDQRFQIVEVAVWRVRTDRGHIFWVDGDNLLQSLLRFRKWTTDNGYFENDASFLAYRNSVGRYCGRAAEAPYAASPIAFARLMVKREGELYPKLKIRSYDNSWGGKSGQRALWTNSMKDYAFDFETAKQGILTLETAFFELTGEFSGYDNVGDILDPKAILNDPKTRNEVELESIEKNILGLWSSQVSRAVYIEIVSNSKTTGFLALALDLLCRNTIRYLRHHRLWNMQSTTPDEFAVLPPRKTRRMNAWQQANHDNWF